MSYREISADELGAKLGRVTLLDVLPQEVYSCRHLPGAQNVCVYEIIFSDRVSELVPVRETPLVVYGAGDGSRDAHEAARKLTEMGYTDVWAYAGGVADWRSRGNQLVGSNPGKEPIDASIFIIPDEYLLDVDESYVEWVGRNANSRHFGILRFKRGQVNVDGCRTEGRFVIDMDSIRNIDLEGDENQPFLVRHLKSDDFFHVGRFPEALFKINEFLIDDDPRPGRENAALKGEFTLKGITRALDFPVTLAPPESGTLKAEAHFDLDRTLWGVNYGSARLFKQLSYHLVYDQISIGLRMVARRAGG